MNNNTLTYFYDKRISFFVVFYFIASAANATMKTVLPIPESLWSVISVLWGGLIVFYLLRALKPVWKRSAKILMISYAIFGIAYFISAWKCFSRGEPFGQILRATAFLTFAWWIPVGVSVCSVKDKSVLYQMYLKASFWISAIMFINLFFHRTDVVEEGLEYNMFFGFAMLTPTLVHLNEFYNKRKRWLLLLAIIEIIALLLYGNRSILLSVLFFVFYKSVVENRAKTILQPILFCIVLLFLFIYWEYLISNLILVFRSLGMQSRTLEMAINGSITDSSGRDELWAKCWNMIIEKPVFGWGLGGEFYTLANFNSTLTATHVTAASAHNGLLQLLVELGLLFGSIAIIIVVWPILGLRKVKDPFSKDLILVFFSSYGITRMVSADGFFIAPQVAVYLYLFYFYSHCKSESIN